MAGGESGDYDPGEWGGQTFKEAEATYRRESARVTQQAQEEDKPVDDLIEPEITAETDTPLEMLADITGSMSDWPGKIFSKLGYLAKEGKTYLGDDPEIAFGAIADATTDRYPFQIRPFARKLELKKRLLEIIKDDQWGGNGIMESHQLGVLYLARKVIVPRRAKPIAVIMTDEIPYPVVDRVQASRILRIRLQADIPTAEVFEELKEKAAVYVVLKPYHDMGSATANMSDSLNLQIYRHWIGLVGEDHMATLSTHARILDVLFGILAQEKGMVEYFRQELEERQMKDEGGEEKIKEAYRSLETIHATRTRGDRTGRSTMHHEGNGPDSHSLL